MLDIPAPAGARSPPFPLSSCPDANTMSGGPRLVLGARWRYRDGITYLSQVSAAFDAKTGLAVPFMTLTLDPRGLGMRGTLRLWVSSVLQGNHIRRYHTSGWVNAVAGGRVLALRAADPFLGLQLWRESANDGTFRCVSATGLVLTRSGRYLVTEGVGVGDG